MKLIKALAILIAAMALSSCAWWRAPNGIKQNGSIVDYLYPDAKAAPELTPTVVKLRPPVKVGIAFVPGSNWNNGLPEAAKMKLLERVRDSFSRHEYIGKIEIIPTQYLRPKGGFANLEQVGRMFDVEVVALLSYDQVQFNDSNALSVLYWTIVGAYVVHGDQYDVQTMLDASVFDINSHQLLFRAPGTSRVKGSASLSGIGEKTRAAGTEGYEQAVDQLVPQLQAQLDGFRERVKNNTGYQIENKAGYKGGGGMGWFSLAMVAILGSVAYAVGRRR
ncbi:rhombotarget lipoprotein [Duganella sp. FT80W]|uniref:Rhombotarget lipoprotein n=1 Tax=Duganella guangzhouensis TaxID=2666084 RepID=A0A6I2L1W1_9BURK|nr:rhombotarget lipoprotein [Duganella guangzhouensis]MRW90526.1 rhombotarget lipoprotein [Duganella guangzhouensis]